MLNLEPYLLLPLALVLVLMTLPVLSRKFYGPINYILPLELSQRLSSGEDIAIIDLRPKKEFEHHHIEGALNVGARQALNKLDGGGAGLSKFPEQPLVIVCASDLYSVRLASKLSKKGFSGVMVLKGGIYKWKRDRLPVVATAAAP